MTILAIDQGTTSTKGYRLFDDGSLAHVGSRRHRQHYPHPGWVEFDPLEVVEAVRELITTAGPFDALGLANQGETVVAWDARTKRPLHPAIGWQDVRTGERIDELRAAGVEALTLERAGLRLDPYFSAGKMRWLLDHAQDARALLAQGRLRLGTSDAYLLDVLTGTHATDVSTASRTSLLDLTSLRWDEDLCAAFGVPRECLPEIRPTAGDFGALPGGAHVAASAVDQQASLFGHGCRDRGDLKITFGTGAFALALTGAVPLRTGDASLVPTCAWRIADDATQYALDGGVYTAAAAVDWLRGVGLFDAFEEIATFVGPTAASRGLMFVPAHAGLGGPYCDRSAQGLWIGIGLETSRADLCRAVLEGVALRAAQLVGAFETALGTLARISIDGGMSRNPYFVQFLADALGCPVDVAETSDLTALGMASLCRPGWDSGERVKRCSWRRVEPVGVLDAEIHARFA
ncbi:MAG TPA: FGGY family carbohydrate kinase, partial [Candidatus Limnocylindria bacterium]|nr:FGGY family carbohydrate kinase [Candidatus Limnocylindria bacterium]